MEKFSQTSKIVTVIIVVLLTLIGIRSCTKRTPKKVVAPIVKVEVKTPPIPVAHVRKVKPKAKRAAPRRRASVKRRAKPTKRRSIRRRTKRRACVPTFGWGYDNGSQKIMVTKC
jgi:hypothetical protein